MTNSLRVFATFLCGATLLTACGDDDDTTAADDTTTSSESSGGGDDVPDPTVGADEDGAGTTTGEGEDESTSGDGKADEAGAGDETAGTEGADEGDDEDSESTGVSSCVQVAPGELVLVETTENYAYWTFSGEFLGSDVMDDFQLEFWASATGSFDLAQAPNDNYATCTQCVRLFEDVTDTGAAAQFYQERGTLVVDAEFPPLSSRAVSVEMTGVRLVEVTVDSKSFMSTPVPDGGCIDIVDGTYASAPPPEVPDEWTCDPFWYGAEDGCDCGCGVVDPDCADATVASCEFCTSEGSCGAGSEFLCGVLDPNDNGVCAPQPPEEWTCAPGAYGLGDGCDCGCGILDPDCTDASAGSCETCDGIGSCSVAGFACDAIEADDNSQCAAPAEWTCTPSAYEDGENCDCGCGVADPDCGDDATVESCVCDDTSCSPGCTFINTTDLTSCVEWTCEPAFYGDGTCQCGCGSVDPDCEDSTSESCEVCDSLGSCSVDFGFEDSCDAVAADNNGQCGWTCNPAFYGADDGCDCGCGLIDPDCEDPVVDSCAFCNNAGSCAVTCDDIDPEDIGSCVEVEV